MKYRKQIARVLIIVLAAISAAGCGKGISEKKEEKREIAMGRYVEETVAMPEAVEAGDEIAYLLTKEDERLVIYSVAIEQMDTVKYTLQPDNSWERTIPEWLAQTDETIESIAVAEDGTIYALMVSYGNDKAKIHIKKSEDGKTLQELAVEGFENEVDYRGIPIEIKVLPDGRLLLTYYDRVIIYKDGKAEIEAATGNYQCALSASGDYLLLVNENSDGMYVVDTKTGETVSDISAYTELNSCVFTSDSEGNWYALDSMGISRLIKNGSVWETIVDGELASMSMPSYNMDGLLTGGSGDFYAMYQYGEGKRDIKHYYYDENVPTVPEEKLTVLSMEENAAVKEAIVKFQLMNSNVKIDYRSTNSQNGGISREDQIKAINAELLAGNGADLYILDGMPADSFVEKGALADISDLIIPMEESGELLPNIIDCYKKNGAVYMVPINFIMPVAFGTEEAVNNCSSIQLLEDYVVKYPDRPLFCEEVKSYNQLGSKLYQLYSDSFIGENKVFDEEKLMQFMETVNAICQQSKAVKEEEAAIDGLQEDSILEGMLIYGGDSALGLINIYTETDIYAPMSAIDQTGGIYASIASKFIPSGLIGVNNASTRKELAYKFIRELYSEEVQKADVGQGFPVNRKAMESYGLEPNDYYISCPDNFEATQPDQEKMKKLTEMVKTLKQPIDQNEALADMVLEEMLPYLKGQIQLQAAADKIMNRVSSYLAE